MVNLIGLLSRFNPRKVLVIGDFMLDTYTTGKVKRISPEAPVSVLLVQKEEGLPGGAGNVALNLLSLGASVSVVGRVGADSSGAQLLEILKNDGIDTSGMVIQEGFKTPVKNRLIADSQQVLRVDFENITPIPEDIEETVLEMLPALFEEVAVIAISDYAKGFLSRHLLSHIIQLARARGIPVVVDPKGEDFSKYFGATVIKPNLSEAYGAAKMPLEASLDSVAAKLLEISGAQQLLITRSEAGISIFNRNAERSDFPVRLKEVKDVTGAGDTVLAMISIALANGLDLSHGSQLANIAAGIAIERVGCARVNLSDLATRLLEFDIENKIFDEEHLFALQQALQGKKYTVLGLESSQGMSTALFKTIRSLAREQKLILYVRDEAADEEFISLLASLAEVDFIVLKRESLRNLCDIIHPDRLFIMEGQQLISLDHTGALLS